MRIGPPPAAASYLNIDAIIAAALATGAEAVHPGYGFLAENAAFARACAAAGLVFVGPPPGAIEAMGDKIAGKATVAAAGVPVVPGTGKPGMSDEELIISLNGPVFPLLVKPSAGGGGKGMRVVNSAGELPAALAAARREARAAFGDDTLLIERYITRPRHIEIQVLADTHGTVTHLGERECSLQRRHQKIIEEAPSPLLDAMRREAMGGAAVEAARSVGYTGAGTVEFIVPGDSPDEFYFMEMNTRLQVEHPVTELVYGLDLVEWQLRVAAGERLTVARPATPAGHAVEARVYAEDPARGFLPTGGTVLALREPSAEGVRVDSGLAEGMTVTSAYDPMLAKVAAWGPDRATALDRLDAALAETAVLGVTTNIAFLRTLLADPDVQAGHLDTTLAERVADRLASPALATPAAVATPPVTRYSLRPRWRGCWRGNPRRASSIRGTSPMDGGSAGGPGPSSASRSAPGGRVRNRGRGARPGARVGRRGSRGGRRRPGSGPRRVRDGSPSGADLLRHLRGAGAAVRVRDRRGHDLAGARRARVGADRGRGGARAGRAGRRQRRDRAVAHARHCPRRARRPRRHGVRGAGGRRGGGDEDGAYGHRAGGRHRGGGGRQGRPAGRDGRPAGGHRGRAGRW